MGYIFVARFIFVIQENLPYINGQIACNLHLTYYLFALTSSLPFSELGATSHAHGEPPARLPFLRFWKHREFRSLRTARMDFAPPPHRLLKKAGENFSVLSTRELFHFIIFQFHAVPYGDVFFFGNITSFQKESLGGYA